MFGNFSCCHELYYLLCDIKTISKDYKDLKLVAMLVIPLLYKDE